MLPWTSIRPVKKHLSERRQRNAEFLLKAFTGEFGGRKLDAITAADLKGFHPPEDGVEIGEDAERGPQRHQPAYIDAVERGHVAKNFNPSKEIKAERLKSGDVGGILLPSAVRQILNSVEDESSAPGGLVFRRAS